MPTATTSSNDSITIVRSDWVPFPFAGSHSFSHTYEIAISISVCSGIHKAFTNVFKIYPNPANTFITVDFISDQIVDAHFSLINSIGQVVLNKELNHVQNQINLDMIPDGLYIAQLKTAHGLYIERLVIKK